MRLLENCIDNSASSEMKGQIEILREAFSADISQPFVLNPSIPFYPIRDVSGMPIDPRVARAYSQAENLPFNSSHPLSPPNSIGDAESKGESPAAVQSLVMLAAGPGVQVPLVEQIPWNPSRLLEYGIPLLL